MIIDTHQHFWKFAKDKHSCPLAVDYKEVKSATTEFVKIFSEEEKIGFWGRNAVEFYNI